jgi:hypothetical protein
MNPDLDRPPASKTLWEHLCRAWGRFHSGHTVSLFLLFAIVVVLLLGTQIVHLQDNPKGFALVLILMFVFFFVAIFLAVLEIVDIRRRHFSERERLYRMTLGEEEFLRELRSRVSTRRDQS